MRGGSQCLVCRSLAVLLARFGAAAKSESSLELSKPAHSGVARFSVVGLRSKSLVRGVDLARVSRVLAIGKPPSGIGVSLVRMGQVVPRRLGGDLLAGGCCGEDA
jgi:hypothetical protein